jgi:hypothetical protein
LRIKTNGEGGASGPADVEAARLEEGENHATTDDELVALAEEALNHSDLGRNLGAADNGSEGALGLADGTLEVVELLLQEEARNRRREELGHTGGGGVSAVGSAEGIVNVHVEGGRELL